MCRLLCSQNTLQLLLPTTLRTSLADDGPPSHSPHPPMFVKSEDLAEFRQFLLARSDGGPVNFDAWVEEWRRIDIAQHVDASLGQLHGQLLLGLLQGQFVGLHGL